MAKILIVAEHDGTRLNASTAKCVSCARSVAGAQIDVAVFAADGAAVAAEAAKLAGVTRVLRIDRPENSHALAALLAPQVAHLAAHGVDDGDVLVHQLGQILVAAGDDHVNTLARGRRAHLPERALFGRDLV